MKIYNPNKKMNKIKKKINQKNYLNKLIHYHQSFIQNKYLYK